MEVYVDNTIFKLKIMEAHAADLEEVFRRIRKFIMRLKTNRGIEAT